MSTPLECVVAHIKANLKNLTEDQLRDLDSEIRVEIHERDVEFWKDWESDNKEKQRFVSTIMGWQ